jgi:peptidoglycan DL-endopeptidase CwlO
MFSRALFSTVSTVRSRKSPSGVATRRARRRLVFVALAASSLVSAGHAHADAVEDQRRKVEQIADKLDQIADRVGELDDMYGAAQDRLAELDLEIADVQAKIATQEGLLGELQATMKQIAVDKFTSGGSSELSPLFSSAAVYTDAQQRNRLGRVALDIGEGTADDLDALVNDLAKNRESLAKKQSEATAIVASLEQQRTEAEALEAEYQQRQVAAEAELGQAIRDEQERRAQAAAAAAVARAQAALAAAGNGGGNGNGGGQAAPPRGGGSTGGGNQGGGNQGGGGNSGGGSSGGGGGGGSAPPASSSAGVAISAAMAQLGVPYRFAAEEPGSAFDCSGLTKYAWGRAGVSLPHQSKSQYASVPHVSKDQAAPGDLIFYYSPIGHVGIYLGNGQLIHAPRTGDVVKISSVNWGKVVGVGRPG